MKGTNNLQNYGYRSMSMSAWEKDPKNAQPLLGARKTTTSFLFGFSDIFLFVTNIILLAATNLMINKFSQTFYAFLLIGLFWSNFEFWQK